MKKVKYFIFSLICLFSCSIVFATNEITVDSMIPVYDENSGVIVSEENGVHSVIFNDKEQSVKYNIVLKNNTDNDISLENVVLPEAEEDFFKYELTGVGEGAVLEANSTKDVVLSLETIKTEGWGRNFNLDLTGKVEVLENVTNPNTVVKEFMFVLAFVTCTTGILIITVKNRKVARYVALIVMFGSVSGITNAKEPLLLPIKLNVSFESQNVMSKSGVDEATYIPGDPCFDEGELFAFWKHSSRIENIYIVNEIREVNDYAYKYDVSEKQNGRVLAYLLNNESDNSKYDLYLMSDGIIYPNSDASYYFGGMYYLETINNLEGLDTSNVTNMSYMFTHAGEFSEIFTLDVSNFDTSNVTDMSSMFKSAGFNSSNFTLDVSNFDTSNVTDMSSMFSYNGCNNPNFTLDVSNFDTRNVTDMSYMFDGAGINSSNFILDVSNFDTSNVTNMSNMLRWVGNNSENFTLDVSNFDTSKVTNMSGMFSNAGYSNPTFTLDVSNFDTSKVTNMSGMFSGTGYSNPNFTLDVSNFDTRNVTSMSSMFSQTGYNNPTFTLDVSNFDTSNVTDMSYMFYNTGYNSSNFTLDVSSFDTSKVTSMRWMFYGTGYSNPNFTLDVSNFDTSNVTDMSSMFKNAGYNSTAFVTTFTIRPKITNSSYYKEMFSGVATKPGSKITVNYTSANSSYINTYINTKSSNSNVVKGVQVD